MLNRPGVGLKLKSRSLFSSSAMCGLKRLTLLLALSFFIFDVIADDANDFEDNEFAEFEDAAESRTEFAEPAPKTQGDDEFEELDDPPPTGGQKQKKGAEDDLAERGEEEEEEEEEEDVVVEDDDFDDEFETEESDASQRKPPRQAPTPPPKGPEIVDIPHHLRTNWDSFVIEMLMCAGLIVYFVNFFVGKSKNYKLANAWLQANRGLLEHNFSVVGDDGAGTEVNRGILMKDSENAYSIWCSGRTCVEGMLCELKLLKRQCLVAQLANLLRPGKSDQLHIRAKFNRDDMDTFCMAVGHKKTMARMGKDINDLSSLCTEKKSGEKIGFGPNVSILSEIGEATSAILDNKVISVLARHEETLDAIHVTDQYTGTKSSAEDSSSKTPPEPTKEIRCVFNVPGKGKAKPEDMESLKPMLQLVFLLIDKIKRIRLSKEAKRKADLNRAKIEESNLKMSHAQRQELAQQRREDKRRADKERIMNEEDPEKQRKWEDQLHKRDMKRKQPKVKQMKMKPM